MCDRADFSVYCTLSYSVITSQRFSLRGYFSGLLHFLRYWENELLLLILVDEIVFYKIGVAIVNALLISLVVIPLFRLVEQLVFWRSINAYKKSWADIFFVFYFDFDLDFDFFLLFASFGGEIDIFFFCPLEIIT